MDERPNAEASTADFEFAALREARNYRAALVEDFEPYLRGNVLEVGAGVGQITEGIAALKDVTGLTCVEPDAGFCREFKKLHPGLRLVEGTVTDVLPGDGWDAVVSINVLEHIRDDGAELAAYHERLLVRGGYLCLFVPARPEIYAPIDRDFGHHRRYTKPDLARKLLGAGFEISVLRYFNWVGYFAWWLNFRVLGRRRFDVASVRLFDRRIFPMVHGMETQLGAPPFGQSLFAVARAVSRRP